MIEIEEQGRRLRILVGGEEEFLIQPASGDTGAALLSGWLGITLDVLGGKQAQSVEADLLEMSVGVDNVERVHQLRTSEIYDVTMAAFFWQTAGGIEAAQLFVGGDYPKALDLLTQKSGLEASMRSLSGELASQTPSPGDTPATSTPSNTASGSSAVDNLPPSRRSIRQNQND